MFGKNSSDPFQGLEKTIGYRFRDKQLCKAALTHPSFRYENTETVFEDNQRLEFLGDAVLGLLASDRLMESLPQAGEGELTEKKSALTSGRALASAARELGLGEYLRLGKGEAADGGTERDSNLEDMLEALIGAIWLDGGFKAVRRFFDRHLFQCLENTDSGHSNPKGALQEFAHKNGWPLPDYRTVEESGPPHARRYYVELHVSTFVFRGEGSSRREAERTAAEKAVRSLLKKTD